MYMYIARACCVDGEISTSRPYCVILYWNPRGGVLARSCEGL